MYKIGISEKAIEMFFSKMPKRDRERQGTVLCLPFLRDTEPSPVSFQSRLRML